MNFQGALQKRSARFRVSHEETARRTGALQFEKADRLRIQKGWSKDQLAAAAGLSRNTVIKVLQGEPCFPNTAKLVAMALDVDLFRVDPNGWEQWPGWVRNSRTEEWEVEEYLSEWKTTSNGLQYRVCRLRHKADPRQLGRGKFYDLLGAASQQRDKLQHYLVRHFQVCGRVTTHVHVAENSVVCRLVTAAAGG